MTVEPLETRLREDPGDWASWLVYGDWLLEQGDARGELIRLEHQRAQEGARASAELVARIDELSKRHAKDWSPKLPKTARPSWRNGFLVGLALTLDEGSSALLGPLLESRHARFLTSLRLQAEALDTDAFDEEDFDEETATAPPRPIHAPFAEAVLALDLRGLRSLSFAYAVVGPAGAKALAASARLGPLTELDLRYGWIGDEGAAALARSPGLSSLRTLHLQRNDLSAKGARALAESPHLRELRALDLRYNPLKAQGAKALAASPLLGGLERLQLNKADVGKPGARALGESPHLSPNLKRYWKSL